MERLRLGLPVWLLSLRPTCLTISPSTARLSGALCLAANCKSCTQQLVGSLASLLDDALSPVTQQQLFHHLLFKQLCYFDAFSVEQSWGH